jgi:hypothetical protein
MTNLVSPVGRVDDVVRQPLVFIECCICRAETPAWYDEADKPDMPRPWRGMRSACCDTALYVCSPRCAMQCGNQLLQMHSSQDVIVRRVKEAKAPPESCPHRKRHE